MEAKESCIPRVLNALKGYDKEPDRAVADLLADLHHYCHLFGFDFENLNQVASEYFQTEIEGA